MKSNNSADPMHDAGGPAEGPGERGCLEGGRGGEQASRAGLLVNENVIMWKQTFETFEAFGILDRIHIPHNRWRRRSGEVSRRLEKQRRGRKHGR